MRRPRLIGLAVAAAWALTGCGTVPPVQLDDSVPGSWTQAVPSAPASAAPQAGPWWQAWGDATLETLVQEAFDHNLDLAQAGLRLRQQRVLAGTAASPYRPVVSGDIRTLQDIAAVDSYFHASIDMVWELGLFGAKAAAEKAGAAAVLDAQAQWHAARVALVADVIHRYLDLRMAQVQRSLLDEQAALDERALQLARVRRTQRLGSAAEVHQHALRAAQTQAQQAALAEIQARAAHALAALLGRTRPEPQWLQADAAARLPEPHPLPVQALPADLLRTRPDIQLAQAEVERAGAALGLARSALYPRFALAGSLLHAYNLTQNAPTTSDHIPNFGPQIDIPLFDWSHRRNQANAQELALQAAVLAYRQSVLDGVAEAESCLAALAAQRGRLAALETSHALLQMRLRAQSRRRELGLESEYGMLPALRDEVQARSELATARATHALAYVALYKALGGAELPPGTAPEEAAPPPVPRSAS